MSAHARFRGYSGHHAAVRRGRFSASEPDLIPIFHSPSCENKPILIGKGLLSPLKPKKPPWPRRFMGFTVDRSNRAHSRTKLDCRLARHRRQVLHSASPLTGAQAPPFFPRCRSALPLENQRPICSCVHNPSVMPLSIYLRAIVFDTPKRLQTV